ncbi:unnamed protein product, partial [Iphiclides podalirius]
MLASTDPRQNNPLNTGLGPSMALQPGCPPGFGCRPLPLALAAPPLPAVQVPHVVYAQAVYEPVVHDHPPIHRIRQLIEADKRRRRKKPRHSSESSYSDTSGPSSNSDSDYYR